MTEELRSKSYSKITALLRENNFHAVEQELSRIKPITNTPLEKNLYDTIQRELERRRKSFGNRPTTGLLHENKERPTESGTPLVSVITVVFNRVGTIQRCLESVYNQTYRHIEHIVIDGGSTDGTLKILEKRASTLKKYISEPDHGIYNAMNKGLKEASGEYVIFLNSDDWYISTAIEELVNVAISNEADGAYAGFYYVNADGYITVADEAKPWDESLLIQGIPGGHGTFLIKNSAYRKIGGFDEAYRIVGDYDLIIRAYLAGLRFVRLQKNVLYMSEGGASYLGGRERDENISLLNKTFDGLTTSECDFLYELKYYKNWRGYQQDHKKIFEVLSNGSLHGALYEKALFLTLEQRKRPVEGKIKPLEKTRSDRLKICIALTYLSGKSGGAERITIESANALHRQGHAVTVLQCSGLGEEPFYPLDAGITLIDLAVYPYKEQFLMPADEQERLFREMSQIDFPGIDVRFNESDFQDWKNSHHFWRSRVYSGFFVNNSFDVVICHMPSTWQYILSGYTNPRTLYIASLHNSPKFKFYSSIYPAENNFERYVRLLALQRADKIGVLFEEFISELPECYLNKGFVLTNFLTPDIHNKRDRNVQKGPAKVPDNSDGLTISLSKKVLLSVGRLSEQKDHATLLRAWASVRSKLRDWELKIYGEGPLENELRALCKQLELNADEIFQGVRKNLRDVYGDSELFVLPSVFEGFGLAALEASANGLPVVVFDDCPGLTHIYKDTGAAYLVQGADRVESLGSQILELCQDETARRLTAKAGLELAKRYQIQNYGKTLLKIYNEWKAQSEGGGEILPIARNNSTLRHVILTTYTEGGAGIAAYRAAEALRANGESVSVVSFSDPKHWSDYKAFLSPDQQALYDESWKLSKDHTKPGSTFFANQLFPGLKPNELSFLSNFDVIHLHWVQFLLSVDSIEYVLNIGRKVIWTAHDMAPFTGGCHYSAGCTAYETGCKTCPQLSKDKSHFPGTVMQAKLRKWNIENLLFIAPSNWLTSCAQRSLLFKGVECFHVPNTLPMDVFSPTGRYRSREYFNLPQDKFTVMFSCQSHKEIRKGFSYLIELDKLITENGKDWFVIALGNDNDEMVNLRSPKKSLGFLKEEWEIAVAYSAADAVIVPSLEDNLPNVILEAMSCDRPLVTFSAGGCGEYIVEGLSGAKVDVGSVSALYKSLLQLEISPTRTGTIRDISTLLFNNARYWQNIKMVCRSFGESRKHG
jgi:glycosyltransferase involved in cell wall biosynthesis